MDEKDAQIAAMTERVGALEQQLARLTHDLNRVVRVASDYDETLRRHTKLLQRNMEDAFGRIKNLELTVFPNLAADMVAVYDAIGDGEDKDDNPLDHREDKKP